MSESAILWLVGTVITVQLIVIGALASALWNHVSQCRGTQDANTKALAEIMGDVKRIKCDIGDHESGMRGALHAHGSDLQYQGSCIWLIADKLGVDLPPPEKRA